MPRKGLSILIDLLIKEWFVLCDAMGYTMGQCYAGYLELLTLLILRKHPQKSANPVISLVQNNVSPVLIGPLFSPS